VEEEGGFAALYAELTWIRPRRGCRGDNGSRQEIFMSKQAATLLLPVTALRQLAAAPHRLLFFVGAANVLLAMTWWAVWLVNARWQGMSLPQPPVPAGWMHAIVMQYQVLPSFMFGFLLTVFPRWMNLPPLTRRTTYRRARTLGDRR
jgi:hypothetical protein